MSDGRLFVYFLFIFNTVLLNLHIQAIKPLRSFLE